MGADPAFRNATGGPDPEASDSLPGFVAGVHDEPPTTARFAEDAHWTEAAPSSNPRLEHAAVAEDALLTFRDPLPSMQTALEVMSFQAQSPSHLDSENMEEHGIC